MFLSANAIRRACREVVPPLITGCPDNRFDFIEGSAFDLTIGSVWLRPQDRPSMATLGALVRDLGEWTPLHWETNRRIVTGSLLIQSRETLNLPLNMVGIVRSRTSIFRAGAMLSCSAAHPGYSGKITCGLYVPPGQMLKIEKGARFASVHFAYFDSSDTDAYRGIWGGDKITTDGEERGF